MLVRAALAAFFSLTVALSAAAESGDGPGSQDTPLSDPARPDADRDRDPGSRPLEVYAWAGIEPGMVVADLMPFSGYNSHLLGHVVGPSGTVLAPWAFSDAAVEALEGRFEEAGLSNVRPMRDVSDVADDSIDLWLTVRNLHDLLIPSIGEQFGFDGDHVMAEMLRTLKPGGSLIVVDARTLGGGLDAQTHRLHEDHAIEVLEAAGFEFVEGSELLRVEDDDYGEMGFPTRYDVDRFLLRMRKPS